MKAALERLARIAIEGWCSSRALRFAVILTALDIGLGCAFSWVSRSRGLLSPGGAFHADVALLGAGYLLARVAVRFAVPALLTGAIAAALLKRIRERRRSGPAM